jgi:hypothetical protein
MSVLGITLPRLLFSPVAWYTSHCMKSKLSILLIVLTSALFLQPACAVEIQKPADKAFFPPQTNDKLFVSDIFNQDKLFISNVIFPPEEIRLPPRTIQLQPLLRLDTIVERLSQSRRNVEMSA